MIVFVVGKGEKATKGYKTPSDKFTSTFFENPFS